MEIELLENEAKQTNGKVQEATESAVSDMVKYVFNTPFANEACLHTTGNEQSPGIVRKPANNLEEPKSAILRKYTEHIDGQEKPFRLLDLPRELRDLIYEKAIMNSKLAWLCNVGRAQCSSIPLCRNLEPSLYATSSPMVFLNKQVREEYIELLYSTPEILVNVNISDRLSTQHIINMIEIWTILPNGLLAKCPGKITVNFLLNDWEEFMLYPESSRANKRAVINGLKQWLRVITQASKARNAPKVEYTAQGNSCELNAFKWSWKKLDLSVEEAECEKLRDEIVQKVIEITREVGQREMDDYDRAKVIETSTSSFNDDSLWIWCSTLTSVV